MPVTPSVPPAPVGWELSGPPGAPVVVVLGGISAGRHVTATAADPAAGWWDPIVGPGRALDTRTHRVLGVDWLVPTDRSVTTADQADAVAAVLDSLGLPRVAAIVGASYGGMVALAFGARHAQRVERLAVIAAAHQSHPMATAHRVVQRRIVRLGLAAGTPAEGVALARALAITTYRTADEFAARFDTVPEQHNRRVRFPVEGYLDHAAERFAAAWSPERYLALSESLDLHRVDPAEIAVPLTLLGIAEDGLVPFWQLEDVARRAGATCRLERVHSIYGHDGFLKEVPAVADFLRRALSGEVSRAA